MSNKANISSKDQRILHTKSGNRCAMCKIILVDPNNSSSACIGENAHIYGEKPGAARYDALKPETFVNSEENLIYLCCNCHKKIDTDYNSYSPDELFKRKHDHEKWVVEQLEHGTVSYSFAELEVLANYIIESCISYSSNPSYSLIKIEEKIKKNSLQEFQNFITMGLSSNAIIEEYFNRHPDVRISEKITSIMSTKYKELKDIKKNSVEIFNELWDFASGNNHEFKYKAAGLGILTYFFEKCEVFEK